MESLPLASYFRRLFAFLIDAALVVGILILGRFTIGEYLIKPGLGYQETASQIDTYLVSTNIPEKKEENHFTVKVYEAYDAESKTYGYQKYEQELWDYFTVFIPSHTGYEVTPEGWTKTTSNKAVARYDMADVHDANKLGQWVYTTFFEGPYYLPYGGENPDYTHIPDVRPELLKLDGAGLLENRVNLNEWFLSSDYAKGAFLDATQQVYSQPELSRLKNELSLKGYSAYLPFALLSPVIFFFLIPLTNRKGKTLGKLVLRLEVVDASEQPLDKPALVLRQLILTAFWFVLAIPTISIAILILAILLVASYMSVVISVSNQGFHDRLAHSYVISRRGRLARPEDGQNLGEVLSIPAKKRKAYQDHLQDDTVNKEDFD